MPGQSKTKGLDEKIKNECIKSLNGMTNTKDRRLILNNLTMSWKIKEQLEILRIEYQQG